MYVLLHDILLLLPLTADAALLDMWLNLCSRVSYPNSAVSSEFSLLTRCFLCLQVEVLCIVSHTLPLMLGLISTSLIVFADSLSCGLIRTECALTAGSPVEMLQSSCLS